jgi:metal iron transporter
MGEGTARIEPQPHGLDRHDSEFEKKTPGEVIAAASGYNTPERNSGSPRRSFKTFIPYLFLRMVQSIKKFARFVGPGFLIAVAYIDPGNYATDVSAGAEYRYALLFIVLLSNLFAIFLQSLCIKLGTVTGLNLAENCREHLPRWLVYILYFFAESAIIATDIAEVGYTRWHGILR